MKAKRSNPAGVIVLLLVGAAGVYGVANYIGKTPEAQKVPDAVRRINNDEGNKPADQTTPPRKESATVLTPKSSGGNLTFESATEEVPKGTDPMVFAVNRYLQNSHITPAGAKVIGVEVKDGVAHFDCTEAMEKTYGSLDEQALIQGLAKTLAQFPDLKKMQFLISGKPIETWGNVEMTDGLDIKTESEPTTKPEA